MTQQTVGILALVALLLPTGGAILARLIGRKFGARATRWVGGLSFVVALGSALALRSAEIDRMALGQMAIFVPAEGPLIDANAFTLPRSAPAAPEAPDLAVVEPTATIALPSPTTPPPLSPTAQPSATAAATIRPADPPSPTQAPLVEPTVTPTSEPPTATTEPTATTAPTATAAPARTPTSAPQLASEPRVYIVQAGDTLRSIAASYDLSAGVLQRYNGLTDAEADSLRPGQRLFIPPR